MKYVILIHSNPDPWGHPTSEFTDEGRAQPREYHDPSDREFDALLAGISASGEFVSAEALGDPVSSTIYGWSPQGHLATDGPYAETAEQLGGFYLIEAESQELVLEMCRLLPTSYTVEVRPVIQIEGYEDTRDWE